MKTLHERRAHRRVNTGLCLAYSEDSGRTNHYVRAYRFVNGRRSRAFIDLPPR